MIADNYCKKIFLEGFTISDHSLSEISSTYSIVLSDDRKYILKLITNKNSVSVIEHDRVHVDAIVALSRIVNKPPNTIQTIDVASVDWSSGIAILLIVKADLEPLDVSKHGLRYVGQCINEFHRAGDKTKLQLIELPWNNFPQTFIDSLSQDQRWQEVEEFLGTSAPLLDERKVVSHNDIHAGNLQMVKNKVIFLDLDEICYSSRFNDLGMAIANFWDSDKINEDTIRKNAEELLRGYGAGFVMHNNDLKKLWLYALRKLYFTEAYYLFISKIKQQNHKAFISELRRKEEIIKHMLS